jgi:hypothetical protein
MKINEDRFFMFAAVLGVAVIALQIAVLVLKIVAQIIN